MCNLYNITANKPQSSISVSSSQSLHWQLTADAWRLPDYPAPVIRDGHKARDGDDALGDAATATHRRASSHEYPQHLLTALAHVAQTGEPVFGPGQQLRGICSGPEPRDEKERRGVVRASWNDQRSCSS